MTHVSTNMGVLELSHFPHLLMSPLWSPSQGAGAGIQAGISAP